MQRDDLFLQTNEATYCPEDNKLRLYVGRVPREEYESLRAEGWKSTAKQDCDFVAYWTPEREDTAKSYAEIVGDEDQSPADRAADRAERFGGYLDKRRAEAHGHADTYDAGPKAHGHQSQARAERAAARHDRHADRALDCWRKAEYWQQRTAGVIDHALYVSTPGVRMGRIKKLESEARRRFTLHEGQELTESGKRWKDHFDLRLAYERQMLEAQGGRAGELDIEPGGRFADSLIIKVNKSKTTGRVVSVHTLAPKVNSYVYRVKNVIGCDFALEQLEVERAGRQHYSEPTPESLAELAKIKKAMTAGKKKANASKPKLINPTIEDAERLQEVINERRRKVSAKGGIMSNGREPDLEIIRATQAEYTALSKGSYSRAETKEISEGGEINRGYRRERRLPTACKVRMGGDRVIVLTDKKQKPLPASVFEDARGKIAAEVAPQIAKVQEIASRSWIDLDNSEEEQELFNRAILAGFAWKSSASRFGLTDKGIELAKSNQEVTA